MSTTAYDFPGGDVFVQGQAAANTAYENSLTQLNSQRAQTLNSYGYTGTVDPNTGALSNVAVDPNNPYGQYQQMLGSQAQQSMNDWNSAAARGIGGGLAQQGQTADKQAYGAAANTLGQNLQNTLSGYDNQQVTDENQRDQTIVSLQEQAAANALQYQLAQALMAGAGTVPGGGGPGPGGPGAGNPNDNQNPGDPANLAPYAPGGSLSSNPGSGNVNPAATQAYVKQLQSTPAGQKILDYAKTAASGSAQVLSHPTAKKNYQAARDAV